MVRQSAHRSVRLRLFAVVLAVVIVALVGGCASGGSAEAVAQTSSDQYAPSAAAAGSRSMADMAEESAAMPVVQRSSAISPESPEPQPEEPQERLRVYSADLELIVAKIDQSRDRILALVEDLGGYVEASQAEYLVLRVPKREFQNAVSAIESEGELSSRSIRTADVTEQFSDLERRIEIAEQARSRLYELLEQTEDTDERVRIVQEIRRLTEQIERLSSMLDSLSSLIDYSRITVRLVARITAETGNRSAIPFPWIANLDPLYRSVGEAHGRFGFTVPEDFAVFEDGRLVVAEAADGTRLRAGGRANEPLGTTEFWTAALSFHLSDFYRSAEEVSAGGYAGSLFESKDSPAYYYLVMVKADEDDLYVVETFFPDQTTREARLTPILTMLEEES